eukprot:26521-Chlamydomonas_euryale.AAC.1
MTCLRVERRQPGDEDGIADAKRGVRDQQRVEAAVGEHLAPRQRPAHRRAVVCRARPLRAYDAATAAAAFRRSGEAGHVHHRAVPPLCQRVKPRPPAAVAALQEGRRGRRRVRPALE